MSKLEEWEDGREELEGLPHSFALTLLDGSSCAFFTDGLAEKVSNYMQKDCLFKADHVYRKS